MAGSQERVLRRRIKSVMETKKITRAFELISASQILRAQSRIAASRPYRDSLAGALVEASRQLNKKDKEDLGLSGIPQKRLLVVIAADRGLCGGYNVSVCRYAEKIIREEQDNIILFSVGKKVSNYFRYRKYDIAKTFSGFSDKPQVTNAIEIGSAILNLMQDETLSVEVISTRFLSAGSQKVELTKVVPIGLDKLEQEKAKNFYLAELEPDARRLLELLLPQYIEASIYSALLEAAASEHTARQRAMASATENAEEFIVNLRRQMNRARQDSITTEIMEIVGGAEALKVKD